MVKINLQPINTIILVHAALIWIGLLSADSGAAYVLRRYGTGEAYYLVAIILTTLLCILMPLLGNKPLVHDIQEICLYDVFIQLLGLFLHKSKVVPDMYLTAAQVIIIWKGIRLTWPIYCKNLNLPSQWPVFGLLGLYRMWRHGVETDRLSAKQKWHLYLIIIGLPIALFIVQQAAFISALPMREILTLLAVFCGTAVLIGQLEARDLEHAQVQHALGRAEGESAAYAKSVAELTAKNAEIERQAAELQIKHAQLEQQALELATKNQQLEALSTERAAMMQDLAERNVSLRDANHDYKVPLLELTSLVDRAQEQAINAAQSKLLNRLELGLEELRFIMADIIEQAKVSTELTTPQMQRLDVLELAEFFEQRFDRIAEKRGVSFEIREMKEAFSVFTNEMLLRRVITNLANNAILYAKPGREVTLSFRRVATRCYVSVYDTGPGIQGANGRDRAANFDALIERIKQQRQPISPYVEESQGHGLGLQIVQRLCRELGTQVELKSKPGLGTVFRFSLPLADI